MKKLTMGRPIGELVREDREAVLARDPAAKA